MQALKSNTQQEVQFPLISPPFLPKNKTTTIHKQQEKSNDQQHQMFTDPFDSDNNTRPASSGNNNRPPSKPTTPLVMPQQQQPNYFFNSETSGDRDDDDDERFDLGVDEDEEYAAHQLFLEEQEDLQMLHEDAIKTHRKRDLLSKLLMVSNTLIALLLLVFIALFVLVFLRYRSSLAENKKQKSEVRMAQLASCPLLEQYYNETGSAHQSHQPYFSDKFLADMHGEIRQKFIKLCKEEGNIIIFDGDDPPGLYLHIKGSTKDMFATLGTDFYQNRPFLYLTGVDRPNFDVIIDLIGEKTTLFAPDPDRLTSIWIDGKVETSEELKQRYGVDSVQYQSNFHGAMIDTLNRTKSRTFSIDADGIVYDTSLQLNDKNETIIVYEPNTGAPFLSLMQGMRDTKTKSELEVLKKIYEISSHAHTQTMKQVQPGITEYQASAYFDVLCKHCGARKYAYTSIVATGANAAVLHYTERRDWIQKGQLLLVDAGAEFMGYASDITRTYPVSGKFNELQALLYNAVLSIQEQAIDLVKPNADFVEIRQSASKFLIQELQALNIIPSTLSIEKAMELTLHTVFQPHGLGHLVGLDVHDTTIYPDGPLKSGMVLTIEPGIYFNQYLLEHLTEEQKVVVNQTRIAEFIQAQAIGVRIEDEVVVTDAGHELLSIAPKSIVDIEQWLVQTN